jgi:hypothetical protein
LAGCDIGKGIRLPIGIATSYDTTKPFAFVNNDGAREVTALAFGPQEGGALPERDVRATGFVIEETQSRAGSRVSQS